MSKTIFKHELFDAWHFPLTSIKIIDALKDNVVIDGEKYTISSDEIETIKRAIDNPNLYQKHKILFPPVLDGTEHKIVLSNEKEKKIECSNLWFWDEESAFENCEKDYKKEDIEYTKLVIETIDKIQNILYVNNIDFYILDDES